MPGSQGNAEKSSGLAPESGDVSHAGIAGWCIACGALLESRVTTRCCEKYAPPEVLQGARAVPLERHVSSDRKGVGAGTWCMHVYMQCA